jgi:hypothetical protein
MAVNVETLEKLERRITLTLAATEISSEVESRLRNLSRTVKADGFRPGKVPMSVVAQRYGYSVQYEVVNDRVGKAFADAATEAKLRVAGAPRITQKEEAPEGQIVFDATFEVYPEVTIGDLSGVEVERISADVSEPPSTAPSTSCASSAAASASAPPTKACRRPTASPSTSKARSTANPSPAARPRTSSSSSAKARCWSSSTRPCAA